MPLARPGLSQGSTGSQRSTGSQTQVSPELERAQAAAQRLEDAEVALRAAIIERRAKRSVKEEKAARKDTSKPKPELAALQAEIAAAAVAGALLCDVFPERLLGAPDLVAFVGADRVAEDRHERQPTAQDGRECPPAWAALGQPTQPPGGERDHGAAGAGWTLAAKHCQEVYAGM